MNHFLIVFIALSLFNVVFSTIRSIVTIKGNKIVASLISGVYYAFYNIMLIYTVADFAMWQKCAITFVCNVIGVFIVKLIEEKMRKDKLWLVQATIHSVDQAQVVADLRKEELPFNYVQGVGKYVLFNVYCEDHKASRKAKSVLDAHNAKYFVSESKTL